MVKTKTFDPAARARKKQASCDQDRDSVGKREVSPEELCRENSFFGALDLRSCEIAAVGRRPLTKTKNPTGDDC